MEETTNNISDFDWTEALNSVNGDRQLLRDVVDVLIDDTPRLRACVSEAAQNRDADALRRAAHALKGSLRFLGEIPSFHMAQQLEELGQQDNLAPVPELLASLERELDTLMPALKTLTTE